MRTVVRSSSSHRTSSFGAAHDLQGHLTQALHGESDFTKDLKGLDTKSRTPTGQRSTVFYVKKKSLPTSGYISKGTFESKVSRDICPPPMFTAVLFTIAKWWKHPKCRLTDEWINKMQNTHAVGYYVTLKRKALLSHATKQMLSEINQSQKDKTVVPLI